MPPDPLEALSASASAAETKKNTGNASEPIYDCPLKKHAWVEVVLVDNFGRGVPDQKYELTLPDGKTRKGKTDSNGLFSARDFQGTEGDSCTVTFPDLDRDAWDLKDG